MYFLLDNYIAARAKLSRAEETSTLETDEEDIALSRQRRKKTFSDGDECDDEVPVPKKMNQSKKHTDVLVQLPNPPESLQSGVVLSSCEGCCF